ncbi:MAG TPA: ribonuclease P protein component [Phycisphaerales bacterium]|nr:ribonuclease P protein component [Phycisphaerales bacterium]
MERLRLPKNRRLTGNEQFRTVLSHNLCASDAVLTVCIAPNACGYARLGVSVGRYSGGSVVRNRLKRLIREAFRQNQGRLAGGYDYLVMPSRRALRGLSRREAGRRTAVLTFEQVEESLLALVSAAKRKADNKR